MKWQGKWADLTSCQVGTKFRVDEVEIKKLMGKAFERKVDRDLLVLPNPVRPPVRAGSLIEQTLRINTGILHINLYQTRHYLYDLANDTGDWDMGAEGDMQSLSPCLGSKYQKIKSAYRVFDERVSGRLTESPCLEVCAVCCNNLFCISENEFLYMIAWMWQKERVQELQGVFARARRQEAYLKENAPHLWSAANETYPAADPAFYNVGAHHTLLEPCPFLNEKGRCICYEARPNICRMYGSTATCAYLANLQHPEVHDVLLQNGIIYKAGSAYIKQYRPIYYFVLTMLGKHLPDTLRQAADFIGKAEHTYGKIHAKDAAVYGST